jgi:TRAP-type C4-dicarboxylate transport system substrate-binding protein
MAPKSFLLLPFLILPFLGVELSAQTTVTFSTTCAKGSAVSQIFERAAEDLSKRTEGQVSLKVSYNGNQGNEPAVVSKMKNGQVDGALITAEGLKAVNGGLQVLELPFLITSLAEAKSVHFTMAGTIEQMFSDGGFRFACWADPGISYIYSRDPVNDKTSLDGLRTAILAYDLTGRAFFLKCHANGIPMGEPEILPSLQTGSVIACYGTPSDAINQQWYTKLAYGMNDPFRYRSGAVVFRNGLASKLTPEQHKALLAAFSAIEADLENIAVTNNESASRAIGKAGIEFTRLNAAALAELQKTAAAVWEEKCGTLYPAEVLEKVRAIIKK